MQFIRIQEISSLIYARRAQFIVPECERICVPSITYCKQSVSFKYWLFDFIFTFHLLTQFSPTSFFLFLLSFIRSFVRPCGEKNTSFLFLNCIYSKKNVKRKTKRLPYLKRDRTWHLWPESRHRHTHLMPFLQCILHWA